VSSNSKGFVAAAVPQTVEAYLFLAVWKIEASAADIDFKFTYSRAAYDNEFDHLYAVSPLVVLQEFKEVKISTDIFE